jgi:hypothetical protein
MKIVELHTPRLNHFEDGYQAKVGHIGSNINTKK